MMPNKVKICVFLRNLRTSYLFFDAFALDNDAGFQP